ncbi:hypothetical protein GTNG_2831 [Geobacillus thermodenitrificans NG80-2]|uniref:Uncharacterized protein n=2 Tax=Geobacillus thermodenitrificans TaxID=33940 RepID=A4IS72_GEOTN|nr:hypothetical protein GTNG_2831 [Geobacillus thermodenitrificans NG80-2]
MDGVVDINSLKGFIDSFKLPVLMSLIGSIIGHYRKNGVIQWPIFFIPYQPGEFLKGCVWWLKPIRWFYIIIDFTLYIFGIHIGKKRDSIAFDLGFLGDLLVGVGTGILAKTVVELSDVKNDFVIVSVSLLAGFAGMSYIISLQNEDVGKWTEGRQFQLVPSNYPEMTDQNNLHPGAKEIMEGQQEIAPNEPDKL